VETVPITRAPRSFALPAGATTYNTGQPTHQSGGELDYAIASENVPNHPVVRVPGATADHYGVAIGGLRAAAEPQNLFNSPRVIENMRNGGVLDALNESDAPGTKIITYAKHAPKSNPNATVTNQEWDFQSFSDPDPWIAETWSI